MRSGVAGKRVDRLADRVDDRVADRRARGHDRRLADDARPVRPGLGRHLDDDRLDHRQVAAGQQPVVEQAGVGDPPVLVVDELLGQGHADALNGAALDLSLDRHRVDRQPSVLRGHDPLDGRPPVSGSTCDDRAGRREARERAPGAVGARADDRAGALHRRVGQPLVGHDLAVRRP